MRVLTWIFVLLIFVATAAGAAGYWVWNELNQPIIHDKTTSSVTVARGASSEEILSTLKNNGIISNELPLKVYLKVKGGHAVMKAGDYRFPSPISPLAVLTELEKGGAPHDKITVIEGWTRFDIAKALCAVPSLKLRNEAEAMALLDDATAIKDLDPVAKNLEGYLFPDTYFVEPDSTASGVILQMVKRFRDVYNEKLKEPVKNSGLSLHNAVTVASIIETEAKLAEERPIVASVIYNRVRKGMRLSMDSTIVYASKLAGKWRDDGKVYMSDLNRDSPYNSRMYKGLPPGPVGSPGLSSLVAGVTPANTNYLYYVRNPDRNDGAHNYYSDPAAFEKGVEALRRWEKIQKQKGLR
ncbi:MAG: endolytic transglycosylase MltG [Candidatus Melainabacteria bacterium]|nr:endolytic transglycosylase MltG [Candidatus Melainabacteria bacterium]